MVQSSLQHLARFKGKNSSCRDLDVTSGLRIPTSPRPFLSDDKVTEAGDLDLLLPLKALLDDIEDGLYNLGHLFLRKPYLLIDVLNDINLSHVPLLSQPGAAEAKKVPLKF